MTPVRWAALAALAGALYFAVQGGEYGTLDLRELRREAVRQEAEVARLQRVVDSLGRLAGAIERDPRMQERVARESFGMIRRGEFLFRIVPGEEAGPRLENGEGAR
ncbi:MAG: septum formation initiator family protein [Gemmatimonadales bacterium]|nr:septum formation initiator family protein [Gemmatimonadales bacterium]